MPIYDYSCSHCGREFEARNKVDDRAHSECPACTYKADLVIRRAPLLDPRMGADLGFPTMAKKWDEKHKKLATGRMKDANATRFGTTQDVERQAFNARKLLET